MNKTFCDRCSIEIGRGEPVVFLTMFGNLPDVEALSDYYENKYKREDPEKIHLVICTDCAEKIMKLLSNSKYIVEPLDKEW